ncbi:MAG: hypothetical protein JXA69_10045 [Phycisphaerae bacterium]|nr:hypothetical protein [Phycisphaerae bacterium]
MDAFGNSLIESLKKPLAELASSDEIRSLLERHHEVLAQVTLAARRETCVWDLPVREQGIHMPLPSLTRFRTLARLVALQARLQIAEGRNADACRTVQTGLAMARHMGQGPTLISALVAVAMAELTLDRVAELIQNTDAPNLYWALTDLPQSFIDARTPMQFEKSILYLTFPQLRNLADAALTPEQAQALSDEIVRILDSRETGWNARLAAAAVAIKVYPIAKQHLVSLGYTPERMEAMPVQQTILLYWLDQYTRSRDEMFKWFSVPYWQAAEGLRAAEAKLAENPDRLLNPCIALLPSLRKAHLRTTMPDRSIAALRCIEAVRLHAAAHDGRPPTQLDDITLVPIPIDPITGAPFRYEVNGNQILLEGPAPVDGSPKDGLRYEMTLTQ